MIGVLNVLCTSYIWLVCCFVLEQQWQQRQRVLSHLAPNLDTVMGQFLVGDFSELR